MNYYFAYGSNLHPIRIQERLGWVELYSTGQLEYAELLFNKAARDGSGKGNIRLTEEAAQKVYGAVYTISKKQERRLDKFEALGRGYQKIDREIVLDNGNRISCFTYQAMPKYTDNTSVPYEWYKNLVVVGAEFLGFPEDYVRDLKTTETIPDKNRKRSSRNDRLIEKMLQNDESSDKL